MASSKQARIETLGGRVYELEQELHALEVRHADLLDVVSDFLWVIRQNPTMEKTFRDQVLVPIRGVGEYDRLVETYERLDGGG